MYIETMTLNTDDQMRINLQIDSHLVHLRNLAYFFDKKKDCDIHATEYVAHPEECLIETKQLRDIYHITNCAACHMSKERLKPDFKENTREVEKKAFGLFVSLISRYIALLDKDIKPEYKVFWENMIIQETAKRILLKLALRLGYKEHVLTTVTTE